MEAVCALLGFLLIVGIGIGIILHMSKNSDSFKYMCGWSLFLYFVVSFFVLIGLAEVLQP